MEKNKLIDKNLTAEICSKIAEVLQSYDLTILEMKYILEMSIEPVNILNEENSKAAMMMGQLKTIAEIKKKKDL